MVNHIGLVLSHDDDAIKVTMHRKLYKALRNLLTSKRNVVLVILVIFLLFHLFPSNRNRKWGDHRRDGGESVKHVSIPDSLTILVREYEDFENRLYKTIVSANGAGIPSVVVADDVPYPPVKLPKRTIVMTLNTSPGQQAWEYQEYLRSTHVAIIPGRFKQYVPKDLNSISAFSISQKGQMVSDKFLSPSNRKVSLIG